MSEDPIQVDPKQYMNPTSMKIIIKETTRSTEKSSGPKRGLTSKSVVVTETEQREEVPLLMSSSSHENVSSGPEEEKTEHIITASIPKSVSMPSQLHNGKQTDQVSNHMSQLYVRKKSALNSTSTHKRIPVLPEEVRIKYDKYTYLPGVKPIPIGTYDWKIPILQKKNQHVIENYLNNLFLEQQKREAERKKREQEQREREKLEAIPEWKRPLLKAKVDLKKTEQKMNEEAHNNIKRENERFLALPPWQQELILRKREQQRLESLPDWQRELILKKRVAQTKKTFENN